MALHHRSKIVLSFFLVLIIIMMLMAMSEGIVRLRQWMKCGFSSTIQGIYHLDPSLGLRVPMPNTNQGNIRINHMGFRGPELVNPKPDSLVRLAFLGASTTFCAEVNSNETTWPHLVWKRLQEAKPDTQFDYVNAAVPGYTVDSSLKNLKYRVTPLNPNIIVIYHATNDLAKDSRRLATEQGIFRSSVEKQSWLSKYSLLWFLVEKNLKIRQIQKEAYTQHRLEFDPKQLSSGFRERLINLVRESQKVAELVAIATFSHKLRHEQTFKEQLKTANTALYYMPYMSIEGLLSGYEEYNRVIREVTKETGVLLIEKEMSIPGDDAHFNDSVHFKDAGSKLMAKRVSDALLGSNAFEAIVQTKSGSSRTSCSY